MNLNITGHHVDLTTALREFVENKLERIERHYENLIDVKVVLTVENVRHRAEATLHARGTNLHAEAEADNMYTAVDKMIDRLDRQACKHKEKHTDHHSRDSLKVAVAAMAQ